MHCSYESTASMVAADAVLLELKCLHELVARVYRSSFSQSGSFFIGYPNSDLVRIDECPSVPTLVQFGYPIGNDFDCETTISIHHVDVTMFSSRTKSKLW